MCVPGEEQAQRFLGNESHKDHFKLLEKDQNSLLVGARNIVYNISLRDLTEFTEQYLRRCEFGLTESDVRVQKNSPSFESCRQVKDLRDLRERIIEAIENIPADILPTDVVIWISKLGPFERSGPLGVYEGFCKHKYFFVDMRCVNNRSTLLAFKHQAVAMFHDERIISIEMPNQNVHILVKISYSFIFFNFQIPCNVVDNQITAFKYSTLINCIIYNLSVFIYE
ncbi:hypothetical protein L9F63_011179, partial [Diploptera punctata]